MLDDAFEQEVKAAVRLYGPMVAEYIGCTHCGRTEFAVHPFCESLTCVCGKRNPSNVAVYNECFGDDE